jgi:hypothetical protein
LGQGDLTGIRRRLGGTCNQCVVQGPRLLRGHGSSREIRSACAAPPWVLLDGAGMVGDIRERGDARARLQILALQPGVLIGRITNPESATGTSGSGPGRGVVELFEEGRWVTGRRGLCRGASSAPGARARNLRLGRGNPRSNTKSCIEFSQNLLKIPQMGDVPGMIVSKAAGAVEENEPHK